MQTAHDISFSYSDNFLETCLITDTTTCDSIENIIHQLTQQCGLSYQYYENTFVIFVSPSKQQEKYYFSGKVIDAQTQESLPFSHIQINTHRFVTDENGFFAYQTDTSEIPFQVSYIGFQKIDTILSHNTKHVISLNEKIYEIEEVIIDVHPKPTSQKSLPFIPHNYNVGLVKLNHQLSSFVPGNNSNTLFNLLRLQTGLLAAGEHTNDYLIWGSYKGQTQLIYDDITLFSIGSYNDHIGAVNPLMIQDIEVYKAGYNVNIGDRIGGIVQVTGKNGNREKTEAILQLNQMVGSGRLSIPIQHNVVVQGAFRYSFPDFLDNRSQFNNQKKGFNTFDTDNHFYDYNFKVNWHQKNGDYIQISTINSTDYQLHTIQEEKKQEKVKYENSENSNRIQKGASVNYTKKWSKKGVTKFSLSSSFLSKNVVDSSNIQMENNDDKFSTFSYFALNEIKEYSIKVKHLFQTFRGHQINVGVGIIYNQSFVKLGGKQMNYNGQEMTRLYTLVNDNISLSNQFRLEIGCRLDLPNSLKIPYFQPRVQLFYYPSKKTTINLNTGIYNQFISENYVFTPEGNNYYQWNVANRNDKVLKSVHSVVGMTHHISGYTLKSELYHKQTSGFTHLAYTKENTIISFEGKTRAYGLDILIVKKLKKVESSLGYNLSRVEEKLYDINEEYMLAPQNQLHEVKVSNIINMNPFYFSMNYIYGSGFSNVLALQGENAAYHRCDIGVLYIKKIKKTTLETGLSILNVLNSKNIKYNEYQKLEKDKVYFSRGTPFTPIIFFNLSY